MGLSFEHILRQIVLSKCVLDTRKCVHNEPANLRKDRLIIIDTTTQSQ